MRTIKCSVTPLTAGEFPHAHAIAAGLQCGFAIDTLHTPAKILNIQGGGTIKPGDTGIIDMQIVEHPDMADKLFPGVAFSLREGPHISAAGRIVTVT